MEEREREREEKVEKREGRQSFSATYPPTCT